MVTLLFLVIFFYLASAELTCREDIQALCRGKGRHVLCQYPEDKPGESCLKYSNVTKVTFGAELKDLVTNFINEHRQNIAAGKQAVKDDLVLPQPRYMMVVEWDDDLAYLAQRLAEQCLFIHDECRSTELYPHAGQTVGLATWGASPLPDLTSTPNVTRGVLQAWWDEAREVTPEMVFEPFSLNLRETVWGDFSQLSLAPLSAVGCGATLLSHHFLLICDYSHTNMLGESTLERGVGECPEGTERGGRWPLLCAKYKVLKGGTFSSEDLSEVANANKTDGKIGNNLPKNSKMLLRRNRLQVNTEMKITVGPPVFITKDNQKLPPRERGKKIRAKKPRPGASALLNLKPRKSRVSLMLDKEGIDQLFEDTGFRATGIHL